MEYADFYKSDGKKRWAAAEPYVERRMAANRKAYTVHEFRSYYIDALGEQGWIEKWETADPERRMAKDSKRYTLQEFIEYYGKDEGFKQGNGLIPPAMSCEVEAGSGRGLVLTRGR